DDDVDLLLKKQAVVCPLGTLRTRADIGDFERQLATHHSTFGIDLLHRQSVSLHHLRGHDAIGATKAHGYTDLDCISGISGAAESQAQADAKQEVTRFHHVQGFLSAAHQRLSRSTPRYSA